MYAMKTYGHLPPMATELALRKEVTADLMATASVELRATNVDLVRLCLDVPGKRGSKQYYLNTIEKFLKHSQKPVGKLDSAC